MQNHQKVSEILEKAWGQKNTDLLTQCLADENLEWYEDVFQEPINTKSAVEEQWITDLAKQTDLHVSISLLDAVEDRGYHRCRASWLDLDNVPHEVDAIFVITIAKDGKIARFLPFYSSRTV